VPVTGGPTAQCARAERLRRVSAGPTKGHPRKVYVLSRSLYSFGMSTATAFDTDVVSVTDAAGRGVSGLVREAEQGHDVVVARHGRPVAAVISISRLERLRGLESDLRSAALVLSRAMADDGVRYELNDVLTSFGFDRTELEAELAADLAAGRD